MFSSQPQDKHYLVIMSEDDLPLIKVVGISASGKSTLVRALRQAGYRARPVSQEHSNVPELWQEFDKPDILIFLNNDLEGQQARRPDVTWTAMMLWEEEKRLLHARTHAHLRINTAEMPASQVLEITLLYLNYHKVGHAEEPLPDVTPTATLRQDQFESK
ncbi:hypothetical protein KFU94_48610 [Chloroflexi bacterium TSY]|nr:hypothetical protein [Chloroflexi bacterium TSY]